MVSNNYTQPSKKRKRSSYVCENCRRRKIRCDKGQPCSQCVKGNYTQTCRYVGLEEEGGIGRAGGMLPYVESAKNPMSFMNESDDAPLRKTQKSKSPAVGPISGNGKPNESYSPPRMFNNLPTAMGSGAETGHSDKVTVSKSELELLKERLKIIEASIGAPKAEAPPQVYANAGSASDSRYVDQNEKTFDRYGYPSMGQDTSRSPAVVPPRIASHTNQSYGMPSLPYPTPMVNSQVSQPAPPLVNHNKPYFNQPLPSNNNKFTDHSSGPIQLPPLVLSPSPPRQPQPNRQEFTSASHNQKIDSQTSLPGTWTNTVSNDSTRTSVGDGTGVFKDQRMGDLSGINPYGSPHESINFFDDYTSIHVKEPLRRVNFGPFAWSSLMKRDKGLRLLWDYVIKKKEEQSGAKGYNGTLVFSNSANEITAENTNAILKSEDTEGASENVFEKKALQADGYDEMIPYNNILKARTERNLQKSKLNAEALPLGLTFYDGQIDRELQLIDKIQMVLPKKKVIWLLIDRYFSHLYPFFPFLDQFSFPVEVAKIIGPEGYDDVPVGKIKVEKKLDLAIIGLLLVILRLAYLSLFCNKNAVNEENLHSTDPSPEAQGLKYLMSNPINITTIDVAQLCLDQFQLLRKTNFHILQLALYMRLYHIYAPEDGDGADGGDSQVLGAMLIQMAYSLGLNREPDKFPDVCNDPKLNHLGRKFWFFLTVSDTFLSFTFGNPMIIDRTSYDTLPPFHEPGNETIKDAKLDKYITDSYFSSRHVMAPVKEILMLVLNVEGSTKMPELCQLVGKLEEFLDQELGNLEKCLRPLEKGDTFIFDRNFKLKYYLSLKAFLISLFFHFHLYYESRNIDLSFFYLKKGLLISIADIMPHYHDLLGNSEVICDMIVNPTLEQMIHKSNQTNLASIVKVNFLIFHLKRQLDHEAKLSSDIEYARYFRRLCRFSSCLTRCAEVSISAISKISNRYYYAWRITKSHTYLLKTITSTKFYEDNHEEAGQLCVPRYTSQQLDELICICECTLMKFNKSTCTIDTFCKTMGIRNSPYYQSGESSIRSGSTASSTYPTAPSRVIDDNISESSSSGASNYRFMGDGAARAASTSTATSGVSSNPGQKSSTRQSYPLGQPQDQRGQDDNLDNKFTFDLVDNQDIDRLWLNLISVKYDDQIFDEEDKKGEGKTPFNNGWDPAYNVLDQGTGNAEVNASVTNSTYSGQSRGFTPNQPATPAHIKAHMQPQGQGQTPGKFADVADAGIHGIDGVNLAGTAASPFGFDRFKFDMESATKFDIFSDLPFDKMFNLGE